MCKGEGDNTVPFTGLGWFWSYRWWLCMGSLDFTKGIEKDCERREQELNPGLRLNHMERSFPCQLWWQMGNTSAEPLDGHRQSPRWHGGASLHPGPNCFCKTKVRTMWKNMWFYCSFYSSSFTVHSMSSFSERSSGVVQSLGRSNTQLVPLSTAQTSCLWRDSWGLGCAKISISRCTRVLIFCERLFTETSHRFSVLCDLNMPCA